MKFIQRVGYYLGGFSIGLILLAFFLNGKKTSCSYGLDARVLKNIRLKKIIYNDHVQSNLQQNNFDSTAVNYILRKGNIDFSKSNARQEPCGTYQIEGNFEKKEIILTVENCDSIATITNLKIE
ncbi:hypothetical protein Q4Q35_14935 [Flavivirga aquimarina]|uniref:DUF4258 domain-containing protein n=1 Tax=Flavivirga aquimarina TaxID=2027862 RepID=A0ABT8WDC2_9FLAO|nr:hypothetical protein [Flavivirga aquimarina]MDO5971101.1 hypothetical protein [Flavivirga aquimarina]